MSKIGENNLIASSDIGLIETSEDYLQVYGKWELQAMTVMFIFANLSNYFSNFPFCSICHLENRNNWNVYCDQDFCRDANGFLIILFFLKLVCLHEVILTYPWFACHFDGVVLISHRGHTKNLFCFLLSCICQSYLYSMILEQYFYWK